MSFHDVESPAAIQYGSLTGAGFNTIVQETSSGHEARSARQSQARHRFAPVFALGNQAEAAEIKTFALGRRGSLHGFRLKDWLDYTSAENGKDAPTILDQVIATGDGTTNRFQLLKTYDWTGVGEYVRTITLPETDTVVAAVNGVQTSAFSVSGSGLITFATAPPNGHTVEVGFEFRVPVRFEATVDQWMRLQAEAFETWTASDLSCIEILDEVQYPERWTAGGMRDWGEPAADISVAFNDGQLQYVAPTAAINLFLPPATYHPGGDEVFTVHVVTGSAGTVQVRADDGSTVGSPIAAGDTGVLALARSGSSYLWILH